MNKLIDVVLDRITMYRLVLYVLIGFLVVGVVLGFVDIVPYSPLSIIFSTLLLIGVSWCTNKIMSYVFEASTNVESVYITALILALIVSPAKSLSDGIFLIWVAIIAMASKYILALNKKHVFNPAAIAVVLTSIATIGSASWWVGTLWMTPFVVIGAYLIVRKLEFEDMVWSYLSAAIIVSLGFVLLKDGNILIALKQVLFSSSLFFLGGIMLTEPLTLPPTKQLKNFYGILVGFLSIPFVHIGSLYFTPELALIVGNIFAYLVGSKQKLFLTIQQKVRTSVDTVDFIFTPKEKFAYHPGQYMEWTVPHENSDSRGNRRYFTLVSSPTESTIRLGVKFYTHSSSYKRALWNIDKNTQIVGAQIAGDFTLPKDISKKLVFMAGGIGITPFRSMVKYLIDRHEKRDIKMFYTAKTPEEFAYTDIFQEAKRELGLDIFYRITSTSSNYPQWKNYIGRVTSELLKQNVPDYMDRVFYLSGPHSMVVGYENVLKELGVKSKNIKKDFFPGLV